jgi:hypothetical protein
VYQKIEAAAPSARRLPNASAAQPLPRFGVVDDIHNTFTLPHLERAGNSASAATTRKPWKKRRFVAVITDAHQTLPTSAAEGTIARLSQSANILGPVTNLNLIQFFVLQWPTRTGGFGALSGSSNCSNEPPTVEWINDRRTIDLDHRRG